MNQSYLDLRLFNVELLTNIFNSDKTYKLIYCAKCNKNWKLSQRKGNKCLTCETILKYQCGKCMKFYESIVSLSRHSRYCYNKDLKLCCTHCTYKTNNKAHLSAHIKAIHLPRQSNLSKCSKCGKTFSDQYLRKHLKICGKVTLDPDDKGCSNSYQCDRCGKIYSHPSRFNNHSKICKPLFCDHCEFSSNYKLRLANHIHKNHPPHSSSSKDYVRSFLNPTLLDKSRDPDLFKCIKCGKSFSRVHDLRRHQKLCGAPRDVKLLLMRFSCDQCDYKTYDKCNLTRHIRAKHLPRDPNLNKCERCEKNFGDSSSLRKHSKICVKNS